MNTYSIIFSPGFKYMGIDMSEAIVIVTTSSFSEVVNLVQKRMSPKNGNALLYVESILLLRNLDAWGHTFTQTIKSSIATPGSLCITSIFGS